MKILITGGHLTPALALIDWIQEKKTQDEIIFVGRVYSQESLKQLAIEQKEVESRGVLFEPINAVKLGQESLIKFLLKPFKFLVSLIQAYQLLVKHQPDVIMSFGSYVAVPVVLMAKLLGVPIVAHEGTRVVGLANKIIFKHANQLALAFPNPLNFSEKLQRNPSTVVGIPLRASIKEKKDLKQPSWMKEVSTQSKILLVMGGNQGSKVINQTIKENLSWLTKKFVVVHQCGRSNKKNNYKQELIASAKKQKIKPSRYFVKSWIGAQDLSWLYQHATLAISRSGANSVQELTYHQVPAIFIPLPFAHFNEQLLNAQSLSSKKAAYLLKQDELNQDNLKTAIDEILSNQQQYKENLKTVASALVTNASEKLYQILQKV